MVTEDAIGVRDDKAYISRCRFTSVSIQLGVTTLDRVPGLVRSHVHIPIPSDPVERIRVLRVLREVHRRGRKPSLEVTYRTVNGSTCGPYYVARWRRGSRHRHGRTLYLGKPENESVSFVEWLVSLDKKQVLELARHLMRNLRSVLKTLLTEVSSLPYKRARRVLTRGLALTFDARPSESPRIRDLLEELPDRLESFTVRTLGGWPAHYSSYLRKVIRSRRKSLNGRHEVPDVQLELERWKLQHGWRLRPRTV